MSNDDCIRSGAPQSLAEDKEFAIVTQNVTRSFGSFMALRGLSFTASYGQVTALVGPNGAGKTTALLILATLLAPNSGDVQVGGADPVTQSAKVRAHIGWMPDTLGTYDQLTGAEYLTFFARAYGIGKSAADSRAWELLSMVHLEEYAKAPIHVLSRGQKQRLAMARALVHQPSILLLDEPASGLDPRSRIELRELLRGLAAEGKAVVVSSHVLSELEEVADRVIFISEGKAVADQDFADLSAEHHRGWRIRAIDSEQLNEALNEKGVLITAKTTAGYDLPPMTQDQAADLLTWLVSRGVRVIAFAPYGSHLESAYMAMTQERT